MNLFNHIIASAFVLVKCLKLGTQFLLLLKFSAYLKIEIQMNLKSELYTCEKLHCLFSATGHDYQIRPLMWAWWKLNCRSVLMKRRDKVRKIFKAGKVSRIFVKC